MSLTVGTLLQIHLGGMIFDEELQKGVKKRFIPAPVTMSLPCSATYDTVIEKGREHFFPDETGSEDIFFLADSSGIPYKIEDKLDWTLSDLSKILVNHPVNCASIFCATQR